jgi:argonaute-like protein implicated in RNA metabolism and viral defense
MSTELTTTNTTLPEKPKEVVDLETALMDLNSYRTAVVASTIPGAQIKAANKLLGFIEETFKQLEEKYREHPYVKDLIEQSKQHNQAKKG